MNSSAAPDQKILDVPGDSVADFRDANDTLGLADRRDGKFYRYTNDIKLAVRVAMAVGRPLLIFGASGCGKSSLVFNLARLFRRRYYEFVVHSRSEARDLYYRFDAVRRLGEAQLRGSVSNNDADWRSCYPFIEPGPLWWVFNPQSARLRGSKQPSPSLKPALDPGRWPDDYADPSDRLLDDETPPPPAALLIDEIDKADPDFPNNLLVPLGSREFTVEETGDLIKLGKYAADERTAPLIVITSNRERELPVAFTRRCVVLEIKPLEDNELFDLAKRTLRVDDDKNAETWKRIAGLLRDIRKRDQVSPAEFLDAIKAVRSLEPDGDDNQWRQILLKTSWTSDLAEAK